MADDDVGRKFVEALEGMSLDDMAQVFQERLELTIRGFAKDGSGVWETDSGGFSIKTTNIPDDERDEKLQGHIRELKKLVKVAKYLAQYALDNDDLYTSNDTSDFAFQFMVSVSVIMDALVRLGASIDFFHEERQNGINFFGHFISGDPSYKLQDLTRGNPYHFYRSFLLASAYPRVEYLDNGVGDMPCRHTDQYRENCSRHIADAIMVTGNELLEPINEEDVCPFIWPQVKGIRRYAQEIHDRSGTDLDKINVGDPITFALVGRALWRSVMGENACRLSSLNLLSKIPAMDGIINNVENIFDRLLTYLPYIITGPVGSLYIANDMPAHLRWRANVMSTVEMASTFTMFEILRRNYMMGPQILSRHQGLINNGNAAMAFGNPMKEEIDDERTALVVSMDGNELPLLGFYTDEEEYRVRVEAAIEALPVLMLAELEYDEIYEKGEEDGSEEVEQPEREQTAGVSEE